MPKWFSSIILILIAGVTAAQTPSVAIRIEKAQSAYLSGDLQTAETIYSGIINESPSHVDAYNGRAAVRTQQNDLRGALTDYSVSLELDALNFDARLGRAHTLFKLKRFTEATADYLRLLELEPGETNTIYFQKSASSTGTMQITTAQSDVHPMVYNHLGLCETELKNYPKARQWFDAAISRRPTEADYYVNRALLLSKMNDPNAMEDFRKALAINPGHTVALSALGTGRNQTAEQRLGYLDRAIESDSTSVYAYVERAFQFIEQGDYNSALRDYNSALRLKPDDPDLWLNRGYVYERLNKNAEAYSDYSKAIDLQEDFAKAWLNRGNVLNKIGKPAEAVEDYSAALTFAPDYAAAYYNRAVAREKMKQRTEACSDLAMAERLGQKVDERLKKAVCE